MKMAIALFALATTLTTGAVQAETYKLDSGKSTVSFLAVGKPGFLRIKGEGGKVDGAVKLDASQLTGKLTVQLAALKTGMDLRDEHMHEKYLETPKFPTATLELQSLKADADGSVKGTFNGLLTLKGVTKPVTGDVDVKIAGDKKSAEGTAHFKISLTDFPVGVPTHLGVTVAQDVDVNVEINAAQE